VLAVFGPFDVLRTDLGDLERAEADVGAELDNEVVASAADRAPEVLEVVVSEPDFRFVPVGRL
jgi:hypothetical protein